MIHLKFFSMVFVLTFMNANHLHASVCLRAENIQELKKDFPIVVVGEVLKKESSEDSKGNVKFEIGIVKFLKGETNFKTIVGYSMEQFSEAERPSHKVGSRYVFPIKVNKGPKGIKQYEIEIPAQGCTLIPYNDDKK